MARVPVKAVATIDGKKVPLEFTLTLKVVTHRHDNPACGKGKHDSSCKNRGIEVICYRGLVFTNPKTGKKTQTKATCKHLLFPLSRKS